MLKTVPVSDRNVLFLSSCCIEFTQSSDAYTIAVTGNLVVHLKGIDDKGAKFQLLNRFFQFVIYHFKRKLRGNDSKTVCDSSESFGADYMYRFGAFCITHGQKHSGKSGDMVCVKMSKADNVYRFWRPALFLHGYLSTFSAVYEHIAAAGAKHKAGEPSVGKRHHSAGSE